MTEDAMKMKRCPGCGAVKSFNGDTCSNNCAKRVAANRRPPIDEAFEKQVRDLFERSIRQAKGGKLSIEALSTRLDRSPSTINLAIESLVNQGHNLVVEAGEYKLSPHVPVASRHEATVIHHPMSSYEGGWRKFGALGDTHFGSRHERIDVVNTLYDLYEKEGVTEVFHTGNWIEGEARFNYSDIHVWGLDDQIDYALKVWPRRQGITTYFVAGDDHEGWWQQKTRLLIGRHLVRKALEIGREDLVYLGYMEGHVELKAKSGAAHMLVMHPGGGTAYAESYAAQKIAEAFQEGEKPDVCLLGHYHKMLYGVHRGIHMVQTGTCQDQSTFMRKQKIKAVVGGCLIELHQAPGGHINRFKPEFFTFFDRKFYGQNKRNFLS